jgi:hypothetical protein
MHAMNKQQVTILSPRACAEAKQAAELQAELDRTIELVTALFWQLKSGEVFTGEQVAAAYNDDVLGTLWYRAWDHAAHCSKRGAILPAARNDTTSRFMSAYLAQAGNRDSASVFKAIRMKALEESPVVRATRRKYEAGGTASK